ncbi:MAG: hypothetical protein H6550_07680 [Chitinophagales bacterium]|nr:hypothetical protein [Chitinophagales bacterium]
MVTNYGCDTPESVKYTIRLVKGRLLTIKDILLTTGASESYIYYIAHMHLRNAIVIIILLCAGPACTYGQDPYYIPISTNTGLPSNTVYHITQDSKGFIWIAHAEGLTKYDGHEFKTYTCHEQTSKPGTNIVEDKLGRIWYQNFDGYLYYVENDSLYPLRAQNETIGFTPFGIVDSEVVVIGKNGFDFFDIRTLKLKKRVNDSTSLYVNSVCGNNAYYVTLGEHCLRLAPVTTSKNRICIWATRSLPTRGVFSPWTREISMG